MGLAIPSGAYAGTRTLPAASSSWAHRKDDIGGLDFDFAPDAFRPVSPRDLGLRPALSELGLLLRIRNRSKRWRILHNTRCPLLALAGQERQSGQAIQDRRKALCGCIDRLLERRLHQHVSAIEGN